MEEAANKEPNWIAGIKPSDEMLTMSMTEIYDKECREQPARLAELVHAYGETGSILEELKELRKIALTQGPILFIGMGASYCSSIAGSVWMQSCGRSSFFADAGEWLHYSYPVWDQVAGSILTTASGESAELVQLCRKGTAKPLALLCNNEKSPCWSLTKQKLPILAGPEYGNATKTYTNATAANIELVGRGPAYGSAVMGALCIREMAGKRAAAHSGAGFRHGPLLDVNDSHVAIIFALGRTAELGVKLAHDCNTRGGKVILVSSEEHESSDKLLPVKLDAVPEPWEALNSVLVPQALTLGMIEQYGANLRPRFHYGTMQE